MPARTAKANEFRLLAVLKHMIQNLEDVSEPGLLPGSVGMSFRLDGEYSNWEATVNLARIEDEYEEEEEEGRDPSDMI